MYVFIHTLCVCVCFKKIRFIFKDTEMANVNLLLKQEITIYVMKS